MVREKVSGKKIVSAADVEDEVCVVKHVKPSPSSPSNLLLMIQGSSTVVVLCCLF